MNETLFYKLDDLILKIETNDADKIVSTRFVKKAGASSNTSSPALQYAKKWLDSYLNGQKVEKFPQEYLDLSQGTPFQQQVWEGLLTIPHGKAISYADLAKIVGKPNAFRAVGNANGKNPVTLFVPCHRVIASDGTLGGYSGGLPIKKTLLKIEGFKF